MPCTHNGAREEEIILEEQLKQCEEEIGRLEHLLTEQQAHRAKLETQLFNHRASIAPIKRISEDVLILIFSEVIVRAPGMAINDLPYMVVGDLLLVCQDWYRIVTTRPTLWSQIELYLPGDPQEVRCATQYLKSALRYSGTSPLEITLDLCDARSKGYWRHLISEIIGPEINWNEQEQEGSLLRRLADWSDADGRSCGFPPMVDYLSSVGEFLDLLSGPNGEEVRRWSSLSLTFREQDWKSLKFLRHPMPLLEHLSIEMDCEMDGENLLWPSLLIGDTPRLTTLAMIGEGTKIPMTCTMQVTTLALDILGLQDLVYAARFCNIRTLHVDCFGNTTEWLGFNESLHFPQLRCMTVSRDSHIFFLLSRLDAPLLHTLCFRYSSVEFLGLERSQVFRLPCLRSLLLNDMTKVPVEYKVTTWFSPVPLVALLHGNRDILRERVRAWRSGGFPDIRGYVYREGLGLSDLEEVVVD